VEDVRGVDHAQRAQRLVDKVGDVVRRELLPRVHHPVQVRLHQLRHQVDVREALRVARLDHLQQRQDVGVRGAKVRLHADLPVNAPRIRGRHKRIHNVLYRHLARGQAGAREGLRGGVHRAVRALANLLAQLVAVPVQLGRRVRIQRLLGNQQLPG
jgi:hypothetical protein